MPNTTVQLSQYNNTWYSTGGGPIKRLLWFVVNACFFINPVNPSSVLKIFLLKLFGAQIGKGCVIKPGVNIKYPWRLQVGNYTWIGEKVWIDNLELVSIGSNCCLSQGAMLLCGNHNYKKTGFDLITENISIADGVWIGAQAIVTPGVYCGPHAVLSVASVASTNLDAYGIYRGNPAIKVKERTISN